MSRVFLILWQLAQPLLFALIGAEVDLSFITPSLIGMCLFKVVVFSETMHVILLPVLPAVEANYNFYHLKLGMLLVGYLHMAIVHVGTY